MPEGGLYECKVCDYWEALHNLHDKNLRDEQYKKCRNCRKKIEIYRDWVERNGYDAR